MTLWGGRFQKKLDSDAFRLNSSLQVDKRLAEMDILGSLAWVNSLFDVGVLKQDEKDILTKGLNEILTDIDKKTFEFLESDEDVHSAIERSLIERVGIIGGKLHTGRSRNDQVVTDFRMWMFRSLRNLEITIKTLQMELIIQAKSNSKVILPGYTHFQPAQPILLSHWWLSFFWPLQRDRERLGGIFNRTASLPLGSGALAGTAYPIDRNKLVEELHFLKPSENSLDAISDRDFVTEFLFAISLIGLHLSRLSEEIILFTNPSFNFFELSDEYSTGSSLMPQKKNPDLFELTRGKSGSLIGLLVGLLVVLKGLPSTYDKDLQEDKYPVFLAFDTITEILGVFQGAISSIKTNADMMLHAIKPELMATDLADYLVQQGLSFRDAHTITGKLIIECNNQNTPLGKMKLEEFRKVCPSITQDVYQVFDPMTSIERRNVFGGTATEAVQKQLTLAFDVLKNTFTE